MSVYFIFPLPLPITSCALYLCYNFMDFGILSYFKRCALLLSNNAINNQRVGHSFHLRPVYHLEARQRLQTNQSINIMEIQSL